MSKRVPTPGQIIQKLREAEVELAQGARVGTVCREIGVTDQTYYRWRAGAQRDCAPSQTGLAKMLRRSKLGFQGPHEQGYLLL